MVAMVWCVILLGFTIFPGSVNGARAMVEVVEAGKRTFGSLQWHHLCMGVLVHHGDASAVITLPSAFDKSNEKIAVEIPGEKPIPVRSVHENEDIRVLVLTRRVENQGLSLQELSSDGFSHIEDGTDKLYTERLSRVGNGDYYTFSKKEVSLSDCNPEMVDANQPDPFSSDSYICVMGPVKCDGVCPLHVDNGRENIFLGLFLRQEDLPSGQVHVFLNMLRYRKQIEDCINESEADELKKQHAATMIQKVWRGYSQRKSKLRKS